MRLRCPLVLSAAIMIASSLPGLSADIDPNRGAALAKRWCVTCHVVGPDVAGGDAGPAFASVAKRQGQSQNAVRMWLADPHPPMPDFDLTATEFEDLAAYIMSLRDQ